MVNERTSAFNERKMSIKAYKKMKLSMLSDFCVKLTDEQKEHFDSLKTEIAIDNFCISAINNNI